MADPTLDTTATYAGLSVNEMLEDVLKRRGLTLDSDSTGRVEATAAEQAAVLGLLKRAHTLFNTEFPESYSVERAVGTWTTGDTALMLPANCMMLLSFYLNGALCLPIEMEDLRRNTYDDDDADNDMGFVVVAATSGQFYWRISGVADADLAANGGADSGTPDWRPVVQLYGVDPDDELGADPYVLDFVRFGEAFTAGTTPARVHPVVQEWVICKTAAMWASGENDEVCRALALDDLAELAGPLFAAFDSRGDVALRARWKYPTLPSGQR